MRRSLLLAALALLSAPMFGATSAQAQATRTWVSGVGDDVNPCSRTAPCKTFAGAISKTAVNGEINCLDPAGYGAVTITKSITLSCKYTHGSILNSGTTGVIINFNSFAGTDVRKHVRLRGLDMNGANTGITGIRVIGGTVTGGSVHIEHVVMDGNFAGAAVGISDERTGGGEIFISDTTISNMGQNGVLILPAGGVAGARIDAALVNVKVQQTANGMGFGSNTRAMVSRSLVTGSTGAGIIVTGNAAATEVSISDSVLSNNGTGVSNGGGNVTIRLSNNDIAFNGTGVNGVTGSFGTNRIQGNTAPGTVPTLLGGASSAAAQQ